MDVSFLQISLRRVHENMVFLCILKVCSSVTITYFLLFSYSRISPPSCSPNLTAWTCPNFKTVSPLHVVWSADFLLHWFFVLWWLLQEQEKEKKKKKLTMTCFYPGFVWLRWLACCWYWQEENAIVLKTVYIQWNIIFSRVKNNSFTSVFCDYSSLKQQL